MTTIDTEQLAALLPQLDAGMIPKMEACLRAVTGGVNQAQVIDGRSPHAVLAQLLTSSSVGTTVVGHRTGGETIARPQNSAPQNSAPPNALPPEPKASLL